MIRSFKDRRTRELFEGLVRKGMPSDVIEVARRKLRYLNAAHVLNDLRSPPGNRLELLKGKRSGQYSIRVNDQYRVCFGWTSDGPSNVEFTDYH